MKSKSKKTEKINKNDLISEVIRKNPKSSKVLFDLGLTCIDCPLAMQETIEEGCLMHGVDPDEILDKLNKKNK